MMHTSDFNQQSGTAVVFVQQSQPQWNSTGRPEVKIGGTGRKFSMIRSLGVTGATLLFAGLMLSHFAFHGPVVWAGHVMATLGGLMIATFCCICCFTRNNRPGQVTNRNPIASPQQQLLNPSGNVPYEMYPGIQSPQNITGIAGTPMAGGYFQPPVGSYPPSPATQPKGYLLSGEQTISYPSPGGQPIGFLPQGGQPIRYPPPGGQPATYPPPGEQPTGYPPPGGQTTGYPSPGGQPASYPSPGEQPTGYPPPGGQPTGYPPPGGQPTGCPLPTVPSAVAAPPYPSFPDTGMRAYPFDSPPDYSASGQQVPPSYGTGIPNDPNKPFQTEYGAPPAYAPDYKPRY